MKRELVFQLAIPHIIGAVAGGTVRAQTLTTDRGWLNRIQSMDMGGVQVAHVWFAIPVKQDSAMCDATGHAFPSVALFALLGGAFLVTPSGIAMRIVLLTCSHHSGSTPLTRKHRAWYTNTIAVLPLSSVAAGPQKLCQRPNATPLEISFLQGCATVFALHIPHYDFITCKEYAIKYRYCQCLNACILTMFRQHAIIGT